MKLVERFWSWLRSVLHRSRVERDMDEELRFHIERHANDLARVGVTEREAWRRAQAELGGVESRKEQMREALGLRLLDELRGDFRYAFRQLRQSPAFTAVTILSLALGIGANTAIFSGINSVMLRMLPVQEPERLVELLNANYPGDPRFNSFAWTYYERYRTGNHVFSDLIGVASARFQVSGEGFDVETLDGQYVVGAFFPALGVQPAAGRLIGPEDDRLGADAAVAVISWSYWQTRFNLEPSILGRRIVVNRVPTTIVGVASRGFFGLQVGMKTDVWVPTAMEPMIQRPSLRANGTMSLSLMARLKPGVSVEQARAEMNVLDQSRIEEMATRSKDPLWRQVRIDVEPAGAGFSALRDRFGRPLLALMVLAGLLLLAACMNIASMLLARAEARQREMAVRTALGAGRFRLVRQVMTESLLLSSAGGLVGVFLAYFSGGALVRIIASGRPMPGWPEHLEIQVQPDLHVLLFTAGVSLLSAVLFGLAPLRTLFAAAPASSLRAIGAAAETRSRRLIGKSLVVTQVAFSVVLLTAAGLCVLHRRICATWILASGPILCCSCL